MRPQYTYDTDATDLKSVWGESDCLTMIADALSRQLGRPYRLERPAYLEPATTDEEAAVLARRKHGSVGKAFVALLDGEVEAGRLQRVPTIGDNKPGDVCLLRDEDGARIGVVSPEYYIVIRTRRGTRRWDAEYPNDEPAIVWRIADA